MLTSSLVDQGFKPWSGQIRGVMVTMLTWSLVYRGFKLWSGQINKYNIGICCFDANHAALST